MHAPSPSYRNNLLTGAHHLHSGSSHSWEGGCLSIWNPQVTEPAEVSRGHPQESLSLL